MRRSHTDSDFCTVPAGSIPAPVIFGGIVDQSCLTWKHSCGSVGNCVAYANEGMARGLFYGLLSIIITSTVLFYLSMLAYQRNARIRAERKAGRTRPEAHEIACHLEMETLGTA
ncbi:hypothetical protein HPB48_004216 [Haemaphysalis longicornis]|uniref:Uncharacterized protein n=1 Tax=Haemaphysalis longicornis TaxID=44386 RepID=A0A9J6G2N1_HAELO|nr:hypothetical protein HPB48_004216 [Haemaphysalis longicornis]